MAEERVQPVADPGPLGLAAFALTTFILSAHNAFGAATTPLLAVFGFALFYGGLAQFAAGMWEFRRANVFAATAFSTYGGLWLGVAAPLGLGSRESMPGTQGPHSLGWI